MVDLLGAQMLAGLIRRHVADGAQRLQLGDNEVALGVGIRIGGMGDLERELGQRESGVLGAGADPINVLMIGGRWLLSQRSAVRKVASARDMLNAQKRM